MLKYYLLFIFLQKQAQKNPIPTISNFINTCVLPINEISKADKNIGNTQYPNKHIV
ncbi:MAG: hypothetical protein MJ252_03145 [archaeon]|nr:hypothetical protein [archaeon]